MGLGRLGLGGEASDERPLVVGLLLRHALAAEQFLDPLPRQPGPFQFRQFRPIKGGGLGPLLAVGPVDQPFQLGLGEVEFRLRHGDLLRVLGIVQFQQGFSGLDELAFLHKDFDHAAGELRPQFDFGRRPLDPPRCADQPRPGVRLAGRSSGARDWTSIATLNPTIAALSAMPVKMNFIVF